MKNTQKTKTLEPHRRTIYWIEPDFQKRFLLRMMGFASLAVLTTFIVCMSLIWWQDQKMGGTFLYLTNEASKDPVIFNRAGLILPMLFLSESLVMAMMLFLGFFYSHRLAGPIHKIKKTIEAQCNGEPIGPITLRQNDEFRDLADTLNRLLKN